MHHIYTGAGKGKTTAAVGLAVQCAGSGRRVLFTQFLKPAKSGEIEAMEDMENMQIWLCPAEFGFTWQMTDEEKEEANNSEKVNTKAFYIGSVEKITSRRGENYITIKNIDGEEEEIKLYSKSEEPKLKSFIVYKLTSSGHMNLQKELK